MHTNFQTYNFATKFLSDTPERFATNLYKYNNRKAIYGFLSLVLSFFEKNLNPYIYCIFNIFYLPLPHDIKN